LLLFFVGGVALATCGKKEEESEALILIFNCNVTLKSNLKNNPNPNNNLNLNPNLNTNLNLYINLNVDRGYPWSTADRTFASVDDRGQPWLQLIFIGFNVAIPNIVEGFLAIRGLGFFGLFSFSALGLLFAALNQLDPVAKQSAVRKNFHALHFGFLELHQDGIFVLNPVVPVSGVGQLPQLIIGDWKIGASGAVESSLQQRPIEVPLHEGHAARHAFIGPKIRLVPKLIWGLVFLTVTLG
jgi:hypothetical protein